MQKVSFRYKSEFLDIVTICQYMKIQHHQEVFPIFSSKQKTASNEKNIQTCVFIYSYVLIGTYKEKT